MRFAKHLVIAAAVAFFSVSAGYGQVSPATAARPFRVSQSGHGRPVILIPGLSSSGATYDEAVQHLKGSYECHVLTLAGFAGVPTVAGENDGKMLTQVEDALAVYIREKGLQHPVIVGHSLGGFLALEFAERYPDVGADLVIVDAMPFFAQAMLQAKDSSEAKPRAEQMRAMMIGMPQDRYEAYVKSGASTRGMVTSEADFAKVTEWGLGSDRAVVGEAMYDMLGTDARPELGKIHGRVLVMAAAYGTTAEEKAQARSLYEQQYAGLKQVQVVTVPGQEKHFIMLDNPAWFDKQLDEFLSGTETKRAER